MSDITELTVDIVAAHVANNTVAIGDVANLINQVHSTLTGLVQAAEQPSGLKSPVVSVRASIKPDYLVCMECGAKQKTLKRHLRSAHGTTPEQYRTDYGLPASYPITAPSYSERRKVLAKNVGLGRKRSPEAPLETRKAKLSIKG